MHEWQEQTSITPLDVIDKDQDMEIHTIRDDTEQCTVSLQHYRKIEVIYLKASRSSMNKCTKKKSFDKMNSLDCIHLQKEDLRLMPSLVIVDVVIQPNISQITWLLDIHSNLFINNFKIDGNGRLKAKAINNIAVIFYTARRRY